MYLHKVAKHLKRQVTERRGHSVKRTSNYSEQGLFRKEVLSFTQEKAKAFSLLFVPPAEGGGMGIST